MSGTLNFLDVVFLAIFFFSILFGVLRGLVREVLAVCFLIAALVIAFMFYPEAGALLNGVIRTRGLADLAGFLLLLIVAGSVGSLIARLIGKFLVIGPLKALDRMLGAVFGLLRGGLLAGIVIYGFIAFPLNKDLLGQSQLAPYLIRAMKTGITVLPPAVRDRLKSIKLYDFEKNNRNRRTV